MRGSRLRFATFCDLRLVSIQTCWSSTAYHIATRCTWPCGPIVATVLLRCWCRNSTTSSCSMTIWARWFATLRSSAAEGVGGRDASVDRDLRAVDVGALVAGEVDVQRSDVLGVADPTQRHLRGAVLHRGIPSVDAG